MMRSTILGGAALALAVAGLAGAPALAKADYYDTYDYYDAGYDNNYADDWYYDYYYYDTGINDGYYDYYGGDWYDTDTDLFDWEEDGLFE